MGIICSCVAELSLTDRLCSPAAFTLTWHVVPRLVSDAGSAVQTLFSIWFAGQIMFADMASLSRAGCPSGDIHITTDGM